MPSSRLLDMLRRLTEVHEFAKGRGLAAPQIGLDRAAAVVQPPDPAADALVLVNPRIIDTSDEQDEHVKIHTRFVRRSAVDGPEL
jgi:peptide deformylase